jgi:dolichol-phosphate mannosyltransferase
MLEDPRVAPFREIFQNYELMSYRAPKLGYRCIELSTLRRYPKGEQVKISPFRGEFEVFQTLITASRGGFDPV